VTRVYKSFFLVAVMVLILASAGCAELPPGGESGWSGLLSESEPEETPGGSDADPGYLTPATPYPTATSTMASPTLSSPPPETAPTPDPYVTLSNRTAQFNATHATEAFSFDLTAPPLIIDFEVEPKMITRVMHAKSDYKDRKYQDYTQTYLSEESWFTVTVRDSRSGKIVAQDGFGKLFSADTHKRVFVPQSGEYLIQFDGNDVKGTHTGARRRPVGPSSATAPSRIRQESGFIPADVGPCNPLHGVPIIPGAILFNQDNVVIRGKTLSLVSR
jgi:hypothetical protein